MKLYVTVWMLLFPTLSWAGDFYHVQLVDCYDGDTCTFRIPWLPHPFTTVTIRAPDVDTPEKSWRAKCPKEKTLATTAAAATIEFMSKAKTIDLLDLGPAGIYGRYPARVVIDGTIVWHEWLLEKGFAVPSAGKRTQDWCVE